VVIYVSRTDLDYSELHFITQKNLVTDYQGYRSTLKYLYTQLIMLLLQNCAAAKNHKVAS